METAKILLPRRKNGPYTRREILQGITHIVHEKEVYGLGMLQAYYEWSIYCEKEKIEQLINERNFQLEDGSERKIIGMQSREIKMRVQWLPFCVANEDVRKFFEKYGEIVELENKSCYEKEYNHMLNGVKQITLALKEDVQLADIPHATKIEKYPALITISGRKPIFFKCGNGDHIFKECPQQEKNKKSFADAIAEKGKNIYEEIATPLLQELSAVLRQEPDNNKTPWRRKILKKKWTAKQQKKKIKKKRQKK